MGAFLLKARAILGKITDYLLIGRAAGWWSKGKGPDLPK